jgi:hypothetical protein
MNSLARPSMPLDAMAAYAADELVPVGNLNTIPNEGFRLNAARRADMRLIDDQGERYDVDLIRGAWQGFGGFDIEGGYVV